MRNGWSLSRLEHVWLESVPGQQFIEIGAVSFGQAGGLADGAFGDLQDLREIGAGKFVAGFGEAG